MPFKLLIFNFRLESKAEQQKYAEVIMDFSYLKIAEAQDLKIEEDPALQDLDDEIRENYLDLLTRFYLAFESTHQYAKDLQQFINELSGGYYIQQNLETVLQDEEGKQLLVSLVYAHYSKKLLTYPHAITTKFCIVVPKLDKKCGPGHN